MKKYFKYLIPVLISLIIIIAILSWKQIFGIEIKFESQITDSEFIIFNQNNSFKQNFKIPSSQKLKPGVYYVQAINDKYINLPQEFNLQNSSVITLNFDLSGKTLIEDQKNIHQLIKQKYHKTITDNSYTIADGKFFQNGQYYATSIGFVKTNSETKFKSFQGNIYHIIFQKIDNNWKQLTYPELIISRVNPNYQNIPIEIVREVNSWRE